MRKTLPASMSLKQVFQKCNNPHLLFVICFRPLYSLETIYNEYLEKENLKNTPFDHSALKLFPSVSGGTSSGENTNSFANANPQIVHETPQESTSTTCKKIKSYSNIKILKRDLVKGKESDPETKAKEDVSDIRRIKSFNSPTKTSSSTEIAGEEEDNQFKKKVEFYNKKKKEILGNDCELISSYLIDFDLVDAKVDELDLGDEKENSSSDSIDETINQLRKLQGIAFEKQMIIIYCR